MNSQFQKTTRLPVHLENQQSIVFKDDQLLTEIVNKELHTTLTHYFLINNSNDVAKKLLYHQMPQFFVWNIPKKKWTLRRKADESIVGRMHFVHPVDTERYFLRTLLLYRKGHCSFESIRTVNEIVYQSNKDACIALGFAKCDNEWKRCLHEASSTATAQQLRNLFVLILLNCAPTKPSELWQLFKKNLADDFLFLFRTLHNNFELEINDEVYNSALKDLHEQLQKSC